MEGQRVKKETGGSGKGQKIAGAVAAVLLAAYLGLCLWVQLSGKVMPNVTIAGIDVSGMTAQEAQQAVERAEDEYGGMATAALHYGDWSGTLSYRDVQRDTSGMGDQAYLAGRRNFLTQGFQYLRHLLGGSTQITLGDSTLRMEQPVLDQLLDQAEQEMGGGVVQMSCEVEGDQLKVTKGKTGVSFDRERITFLAAFAVEDAFEQAVAQRSAVEQALDLKEQNTTVETVPDEPNFGVIHQELYTEAKSAEMLPGTYEITDHVVGVDFDTAELKRAYEAAAEGETFYLPLTITQPKETKASFQAKLFHDLLGQATSTVKGSANRKYNVKLSASACDGVILLPGEEFSYNNTTGPRTADKGYKPAPTYSGGASVDDVGGGICQTSSTIYTAVLRTTLEVVERANHSYAVGYVPDGMDATVWYGSTDFRFKNNTEYPVKVVTESYDSNGVRKLTVKIYGTNADGRYAKAESTQFDWVEPTTTYKADKSVAPGSLVLDKEQNAYKGRKAQTYRYIYEANGTLVEKQDMGVSRYKMRPHVYYYNPLDGDPSTWVNGVPPKPAGSGTITDPGVTADPGTAVDPGTTANPGTALDPGTTADPGATTEPGTTPDPAETPTESTEAPAA